MKAAILEQLIADRAAKRPVVLASDLQTGDAQLIYPLERSAQSNHAALAAAALEALHQDKGTLFDDAGKNIFLNVFNPPLRLIIVGAVHIAQPLSRMAAIAGYQVSIIDPRQAFATEQRFPGIELIDDWPDQAIEQLKPDRRSAIVTLTHDPKLDDAALASALNSPCFYIGSLGSKKTHNARLERLRRMGFAPDDFNRIHGPVGLSINASSPEEIAISILGQITQTLRNGKPS